MYLSSISRLKTISPIAESTVCSQKKNLTIGGNLCKFLFEERRGKITSLIQIYRIKEKTRNKIETVKKM